MSDPSEAQASGGGEGSTPSPVLSEINAEEIKSVEAVIIEAKKDDVVLAPVPEITPVQETAAVPKVAPVLEATPDEKPAEVSISEVKPAEVKPAEVNPSEVKAAEAKAAEVKAAEVSTPEVKAAEVKLSEVKPVEEPKAPVAADVNANRVEVNGAPQDDWQKREQELLKKIEDLETFKTERSEDALRLELKVREEEIDLLKARVKNLETELQAALSKPSGKNSEMINNIKQQHEELLSKARGMIFDKTKMVKNQELQIEALTTQVQSLKDINQITKDLLEIRNSEVKAMEDRFQAMDARFKAEKERYTLVLQRAQTSTNVNDDLKKEYETQLAIFKELRSKYEIRVQALLEENNRLKASDQSSSGSSGIKRMELPMEYPSIPMPAS